VPKQLYKLNDFSGGLNTVKDGADIADNEVQTAQNVMFNVYGGIQPSYSLAQTGNKISAYQADEVAEVEPGYGLGYFETDHARDATTVSFTGANDNTGGSEDGFFVYQEDGGSRGLSVVNNRLKYLVNGTVQDLGASFSIGDILTITGNTSSVSKSFSDGMLFASAQGVYTVVARANSDKELILDRGMDVRLDSTTAGHFNLSITGHSLGDSLILVANPAAHDIDVFSTDANNYTHNTIALRSSATGIASKVKYYRVEDSIRCCDTADKNDCKIQWYGWIQRRHFEGATSSTDQANSYMGYYANDNTLAPPTEDDLATSTGTAGAVSAYPADAGTGFEIAIATETDVDGLIEAGTYELASTFIYDGNQESLPFAYTNTHTVSEDDEFKSLSINIGAKGPYDERISGGRIYIRKQGDDSEYTMLLDIDLTKGARTKLSNDHTAWHDAGSATYNCPTATASANFSVTELGFITYEVINGFSSSIFSNALGDQGEHWKDAVVSNNRVFICNVTMKDEETGNNKSEATVKSFPDRIMYSMPNRYDTFPSDNFIEAAKGDADVYIAIEAYADRLFAYKRYSVDIINIAGDDRNWFLEDSKQYQGVAHPEAVKRTQYGLVWVNEQGLFLYNGSSITNLKENKIDDATWAAHIASNSSIIYDQQQSMVFVIKNMSNDGDAYMCDLKKGNFTLIKDFILDTNDGITNSVDAETERTYIGHDAGSAVDIYQVKRTLVAATNTKFTTKTLDFGNPAQVKKIYAVHLTYKSDVALTNLFTIVEEDNSSTALAGTISASASNWAKVKITPSSPIVCNKASLKLDTSSTSAKVYINDISIEYRTLYRKGV
tara:strand:+ start:257 stop:2767 length:2511 start_codon:yes stop_codon:yes gene_type:complete